MTWSQVRDRVPGFDDVDNVADGPGGPQGAALICELRRLQKFLDQERFQEHHQRRHQEREQFPHAIDVRPADRLTDHSRGTNW